MLAAGAGMYGVGYTYKQAQGGIYGVVYTSHPTQGGISGKYYPLRTHPRRHIREVLASQGPLWIIPTRVPLV